MVEFEPVSEVSPVAFSPDGTRLVLAGTTIQIWDISSPTQEPVLVQEILLNNWFSGLAFNSDGSRLAIGLGDEQVQVWETETGQLLLTIFGASEFSRSMAFSRDGNRLYAVSEDGRLNEWDVSGMMIGWIGRTPYNPDGTHIALAKGGGYVSIVDSQTGEVQLSWQAHSGWVSNGMDIIWCPDGKHLATFSRSDSDIVTRIWDVTSGQILQEIQGDDIRAIAWSPDGNFLAIQNLLDMTIWDMTSQSVFIKVNNFADELLYTPDGTKIIAGDARCDMENLPIRCVPELAVFDATTGDELFRFGSDTSDQGSRSGGMRYSLVLPGRSSFHAGNPIKDGTFSPQAYFIDGFHFAMAISQDGQHLAVGTYESIVLWDITKSGVEKDRVLITQGTIELLLGLAFSLDGSFLAATDKGIVRILDVGTGQVQWEVDGGGPIAFSPDGTRMAIPNRGITNIHVVILDELISEVRSHITRPLTSEECLFYLHQENCPAWP